MSTNEKFLFGGSLNKGDSFALFEPVSRMGVVGMTHENPSSRMTKMLRSSSNISIDISYVIHPKIYLPKYTGPFY